MRTADEDRKWVAEVLAHRDPSAFTFIVKRHQGPLRAWLRRMIPSDASFADDIAQETFLRAYRSLHTFRGDSSFKTWLTRIALSALRDHQRSRSIWHQSSDKQDAISESQTITLGSPDREIQLLDVERALHRLSDAQRQVVVLACWADLSHSEIAESIGLPLGTVKSHFRRALKVLSQVLEDRT